MNAGYNEIGTASGVGIINQTGGSVEFGRNHTATYTIAYNLGRNGGTGIHNFYAGSIATRGALSIGAYGEPAGTGILNIYGYDAGSVLQIGGTGTPVAADDGALLVNTGSTLAFHIDGSTSSGTTHISVKDTGSDTSANDGNVLFANGALLDVDFYANAATGSWDVVSCDGSILNFGLQFAPSVDTNEWAFYLVDTGGAVGSDTLRITYGLGTNDPVPTPPLPGRDLRWTGLGGDEDSQNPENWEEYIGGVFSNVTWGIYSEDHVRIGHSSINILGSTNICTFSGISDYPATVNQRDLNVGYGAIGVFNMTGGALTFDVGQPISRIGQSSDGDGTVNLSGGTLRFDKAQFGESGGTGALNVTGGALQFGRDSTFNGITSISLQLGDDASTGSLTISGGSVSARSGLLLGSSGSGTGTVTVAGSAVTKIAFGDTGQTDGYWLQNSGSTLRTLVDEGGITPIEIKRVNGSGHNGNVDFQAGAVLEIGWTAGVTNFGSFDVMTCGGEMTDNGLVLTNTDAEVWSFAIVDTDLDGTNDTLRVFADGGMTTNGTPYAWLDSYYNVAADFGGDYEAADGSDTDHDGLLAWQEYLAGTIPTDLRSVLKVISAQAGGSDVIITWQSADGKTYTLQSKSDLGLPIWNDVATGIPATGASTSYTTTLGAERSYYRIGLE